MHVHHVAHQVLARSLVFLNIGVPVGLPCVTTTTMAVGAAYLAKQKAIVQKLTAIESLAGVDILCSDKTGTLTANKLSLNEPYVADGVKAEWFMAVAAIPSVDQVVAYATVERARKVQRFMSQPFAVAEVFTGIEGRLVSLKDTVQPFKEILRGDHDGLPEAAFYMVGAINDVKAKAEKLAAEMSDSN
ncbi:hypothetical protein JCM10207_007475 [Rhodosporidiobolus poonsookiae]